MWRDVGWHQVMEMHNYRGRKKPGNIHVIRQLDFFLTRLFHSAGHLLVIYKLYSQNPLPPSPLVPSPSVGWPMSRPLSLTLVWHAAHNGQMGEYHSPPCLSPSSPSSILLLHPLPCQNVMPPQNRENQLNVSPLKTGCTVQIQPENFSTVDGRIRLSAGSVGQGGEGPDRPKMGTFVAACHFPRQPTDMTARVGERRVVGSQDPSRSDRWRLHAQAIMMGLGEEREGEENGRKRAEKMSGDSIKSEQTLLPSRSVSFS